MQIQLTFLIPTTVQVTIHIKNIHLLTEVTCINLFMVRSSYLVLKDSSLKGTSRWSERGVNDVRWICLLIPNIRPDHKILSRGAVNGSPSNVQVSYSCVKWLKAECRKDFKESNFSCLNSSGQPLTAPLHHPRRAWGGGERELWFSSNVEVCIICRNCGATFSPSGSESVQ